MIQTHANGPGIEQTVTGKKRFSEGYKEGIVLVVHIRIEHRVFSEGFILTNEHDHQHPKEGNGEGKSPIIPFKFFSLWKLHSVLPKSWCTV